MGMLTIDDGLDDAAITIAKTEESIGIQKSDNIPAGVVPDRRYFTTAAQLERMKTALIEICARLLAGAYALAFHPIVTITDDDTLTLDNTYNGKVIEAANANGLTITVPSTLAAGFRCRVWFSHVTGSITWVAGSGVTIHAAAGHLDVSVRYATTEVDMISGGLGAVALVSGTDS
jgi:hypothetical protein